MTTREPILRPYQWLLAIAACALAIAIALAAAGCDQDVDLGSSPGADGGADAGGG